MSRQALLDQPSTAELLGLSPEQEKMLGLETDHVVSAGAGAGKTTAMVGALVDDLRRGVPAERIAVCTFTRAAAENMSARLELLTEKLGLDATGLWIGTIDALAARLLRVHAIEAGLSPRFNVASERDLAPLRVSAFEAALDEVSAHELRLLDRLADPASGELFEVCRRIEESARALGHRVEVPSPEQVDSGPLIEGLEWLLAHEKVTREEQLAMIESDLEAVRARSLEGLSEFKWGVRGASVGAERLEELKAGLEELKKSLVDERTYQSRLAFADLAGSYGKLFQESRREAELLDFIDLSERARELLGSTRSSFEGFARLYIDEAQDTNPRQLELLRALTQGPVIAIGDANQSIYGFRQADVESFREMSRQAEKLTLADNYRSSPELLGAINALCEPIAELSEDFIVMRAAGEAKRARPASSLAAHATAAEVLFMTDASRSGPSAADEAQAAAPRVLEMSRERGFGYGEIAVLVRTNKEVECWAEAFRDLGVPAVAIQSRGLFERSECIDLVSYLRLLADPDDEEALVRVLTSPFLGLSDQELVELMEGHSGSLRERLAEAHPSFSADLEQCLSLRGRASVESILRRAVELHHFDLAIGLIDETGSRGRNTEKLLALVGEIERNLDGPRPAAILKRIEAEIAGGNEAQDTTVPEGLEAIRVMTVHQAKGDEFPFVVCGRLSRRLQPDSLKLLIDEEGRLGASIKIGEVTLADSVLSSCRRRRKEREGAESWRLLYVALTRAEEQLVMVASANMTKKGPGWKRPFSAFAERLEFPDRVGARAETKVASASAAGELAIERIDLADDVSKAAKLPEARPGEAKELSAYEPEMPPAVAGQLSYTKLVSWRRCSLRRELEHDLGLDLSSRLEGDAGGGARDFGTQVHLVLARIPWHSGEAKQLSAIRSQVEEEGLSPERAGEALRLLEGLPGSKLAGEIRGSDLTPRCELPFEVMLAGYEIRGQIDLLAGSDEEMMVIDWKSGADSEQLFGADYELQRSIYGLAALKSPGRPSRVRALTVKLDGLETEEDLFEDHDLEKLEAELAEEVGSLLEGPAEPATEKRRPFCEGCPGLVRICPVSRVAVDGD